jgi:predicted nucleic acid-binding protein
MLCDSNVWLALALSKHRHHTAARGTASPKLWMDAYIAAFALAGRYRMVTTDAAFRQFRGLNLLVLGQGED